MSRCTTAAVVMLMVMFAGCGKKSAEDAAERIIEKGLAGKGIKADVEISGDKTTINTAESSAVISGGPSAKLPDDFPKDVYVFEGSRVVGVVTVNQGISLTLDANAKCAEAVAAYKTKMKASGWTEEVTYSDENQAMVTYKKDQRKVSAVMMAVDEKKTKISLTIIDDNKPAGN